MEFRSLQADELDAWFDHVTTVFQGSRQYFMNHWYNDPWRDLEGIRVALDRGRIVSTVRVFIRKTYLHGVPVPAGGIGEVSTHPDYRHQGLASRLLQDAIQFMQQRGIALSSLHTGRAAPLYAAQGWRSIPRYQARCVMNAVNHDRFRIRPADLGDVQDREAIARLYHPYSRRFNGTFVRDHPHYWAHWVRTESPQTWVAEQGGTLQGYLSIRADERRLNVVEFLASDAMWERDRGRSLFEALTGHVIASLGKPAMEVACPAPIVPYLEDITLEKHEGTMYRVICASSIPFPWNSLDELLHAHPLQSETGLESHHVFWRTDGF